MTSFFLVSCNDIWDEKINNEWDGHYVWGVSEIAEGVLYNAYKAIPNRPDCYDGNFLDAATDNALTRVYDSSVYKIASGALSVNNNPLDNWGNCYQQFQYINSFLENGLTDDIKYDKLDEELDFAYKKRLKGEAYFLRAFWGFRLLQQYGGRTDDGEVLGYPIVTHFITEEEAKDFAMFKRDSYSKCAEQIMKDCDVAIENLPWIYQGNDEVTGVKEIGRASGLAASALKSRVALYKASPAYQDDNTVKLISMGVFEIIDEQRYQSQWAEAAHIANNVIQSQNFGKVYGLKSNDLAGAGAKTPAEFIFRFYFQENGMEKRHFPPSYLGKAQTIPSQNLVDAFPMKNGFPIIDDRSNYDEESPYSNRDNRFNLNINYHSRTFGDNGQMIDISSEGKESAAFDEFGSRSGYYLAKFMGKNSKVLDPIMPGSPVHYYPVLRKTEVFLNYAEAANEAWGPRGNDPTSPCKYTAYDIIKELRKQSGGITDTRYLDEMARSKETFRILISNERRLELAFENHRYYDLRRCLLPLDESVKGVSVEKGDGGKYVYSISELEQRKFSGLRYYYSPIPYKECLKNPELKNNLGWK